MKESRMGVIGETAKRKIDGWFLFIFSPRFLVNSPDDGILQESALVPQRRETSRWLEGWWLEFRSEYLARRSSPYHVHLVYSAEWSLWGYAHKVRPRGLNPNFSPLWPKSSNSKDLRFIFQCDLSLTSVKVEFNVPLHTLGCHLSSLCTGRTPQDIKCGQQHWRHWSWGGQGAIGPQKQGHRG